MFWPTRFACVGASSFELSSNGMPPSINRRVRALALTDCALLIAGRLDAQDARGFAVFDLGRRVRLSDPRLSHDGRTVALVVSNADKIRNSWI
jgi:hypothetical protein